ncbi:hypothetical protein DSL72_004957 [Monilinia vaccinii-corymbosi]|uniref:Swiss Army Knife protein DSP-PTPase phosphatase domain-containing protein n=1 Tax=Monilinia vaccinii-corymbosi TaxID=61207 RepID=A0A8A3P3E2_9HELO|nr:hypothetical protein DSL72_004957 [Monilinia vaccinii-corymbosi]
MAAAPETEVEMNDTATTLDAEVETESNVIIQDVASDAKKIGFLRWEKVTKHPGPYSLQRSSSPNYDGKQDKSQRITAAGIAFLQKQIILHVICLNSDAMSSYEIGHELANASPRIAFTHIPVQDYHSPTLQEMEKGYQAYVGAKKNTLVWCGYGWGRTGTMITALQYKIEKAKGKVVKLSHSDYLSNHVEQYHQGVSTGQYETLDALQK